MDWGFILTILLGILCWEATKAFTDYVREPYRWKCKQCNLNVKTNDKKALAIIMGEHVHFKPEVNQNG